MSQFTEETVKLLAQLVEQGQSQTLHIKNLMESNAALLKVNQDMQRRLDEMEGGQSAQKLIKSECRKLDKKRPVLVRHRTSGVWIGYLHGEGTMPDTVDIEGRRIWSWQGGRLECSQLAKQGVAKEDRLGEWEHVEIPVSYDLIEWRYIEESVVADAADLTKYPADGQE